MHEYFSRGRVLMVKTPIIVYCCRKKARKKIFGLPMVYLPKNILSYYICKTLLLAGLISIAQCLFPSAFAHTQISVSNGLLLETQGE